MHERKTRKSGECDATQLLCFHENGIKARVQAQGRPPARAGRGGSGLSRPGMASPPPKAPPGWRRTCMYSASPVLAGKAMSRSLCCSRAGKPAGGGGGCESAAALKRARWKAGVHGRQRLPDRTGQHKPCQRSTWEGAGGVAEAIA